MGRSGNWNPGCDTGVCNAVLWENGTVTDLGMLPGEASASASGINERGQIVGWSVDVVGGAALWTR